MRLSTVLVIALFVLAAAAFAALGQDAQHVPAPAIPAAPDLAKDAREFFAAAKDLCGSAKKTLDELKQGVYLTGATHGAIAGGLAVGLIALLISSGQRPKPS